MGLKKSVSVQKVFLTLKNYPYLIIIQHAFLSLLLILLLLFIKSNL